jgi:hypothetical protein
MAEALRGLTNSDEFRLPLTGIQNTLAMAKEELEKVSGAGAALDLISRI